MASQPVKKKNSRKKKINCWRFMKCGREPGGRNEKNLGICPAAVVKSVNGLNHGKNGGRICWAIAGTICNDKVQGTFAQKRETCMTCEFFFLVEEEEGDSIQMLPE